MKKVWLVVGCAALLGVAGMSPAAAQTLGRNRLGIRLGGTAGRFSGLLGGIDITVPSLGLLPRCQGRIDVDGWTSPLSGWGDHQSGSDFTFCQISGAGPAYAGVGAGFMQFRNNDGSHSDFGGKLVAGLNFTSFLGIEGDVLLGSSGSTAFAFMARLRF